MDAGLDTLYRLLGHPDAGASVADARPSLVLAREGLTPAFANAAGLAAFGRADLAALRAAPLDLPEPVVARLDRFAATAMPGQRRGELVRQGERMERIEMTRLETGEADDLLLVTFASRAVPAGDDDVYGLAALAGEDRYVVLFDENGEAVTAHGDETLLDEVHAEVEDLAADPDEATVRTRRLKTRDGDREVALVALAGGPEQVLLISRLPRPSGRSRLKVPPRRRPDTAPAEAKPPAGERPSVPAAAASRHVETPAPAEASAPRVSDGEPDPADVAPPSSVDEQPVAEIATEAVEDTVALPVPVESHPAADPAPEPMPAPPAAAADIEAATPDAVAPAPDGPAAQTAAEPETPARKFVWQMDAGRRFAFVSPELAAIVGPEAVPRVGETWADLASRLTIDVDGKVAHALAGSDTWSGLTVLWPVAGLARRVPVDLAALPAFGRGRSFEGFRGFGTCRPGEAFADVTATGLRLIHPVVPRPAEPEVVAHPQEIVSTDVPATDDPLPQAVEPAPPPQREALRLTGPERNAFRQIAQALGVRIEGDDFVPPAPVPDRPPARPERAAEARTPETETARQVEARLLDRLTMPCLVAGDDSLLHANPAFLALFGYDDLADLAANGGLEALFAGQHALRDAMRGTEERPVPALTRSGRVVPVAARIATVPWGPATAILLTLEPVTRAAAPAEATPAPEIAPLRERVAELETILDTATDGVLILDGEGIVLTANRAAEALFGIERAEVLGHPLTDLLAPESKRSAVDYLDGLSSNGVASVLNDGREVIGQVKPEGLIPLFMTMGRIDAGGTHKFCAVLRDITQWKKSEEDLTAARRKAEEASLHKSEFLAKISHEIRTPLNAIIGFSEVMLDERFGTIGNERYRDYMRDIHASGAHIMSLVNDLLDLSKVEAGKMDLKFEAVPLGELISECVAIMQPQANRERIIIRASLPGSVPAVVADTRSVRQIVLNLLSNAIKFTPAGGQVIVSTAMEDSGEVNVRVRDTGHGMTEKEIQTALEPFRQLHTTRTSASGTGLGLPLTKALVEANRASFHIASTPGQGTLVSITFPVNRVLAG